jgi:hypothetical protein
VRALGDGQVNRKHPSDGSWRKPDDNPMPADPTPTHSGSQWLFFTGGDFARLNTKNSSAFFRSTAFAFVFAFVEPCIAVRRFTLKKPSNSGCVPTVIAPSASAPGITRIQEGIEDTVTFRSDGKEAIVSGDPVTVKPVFRY